MEYREKGRDNDETFCYYFGNNWHVMNNKFIESQMADMFNRIEIVLLEN
jgi:hypothetical protein